MANTTLFLNDWNSYNNGCIGFGWMTPSEVIEYMEEHEDEDREWFIADIDNYLGVDFGTLEYADIYEVCETIETLEDMNEYEQEEIIALMEMQNYSITEAIDNHDNYIFYSDLETYHDCCDELVEMEMNNNSILSRYFDYDAYHRDCDFDIYEAENGVCIINC